MYSKEKIIQAIDNGNIIWRTHSIIRMLERNIKRKDVISCIKTGEILNYYEDDKPFPSYLVLGFVRTKPLHIVFSLNETENYIYIITVYNPSSKYYESNNRTRIKK
jgi:hypothetical protein